MLSGKFEEDFLHIPPTLVLEIALESTRLKDRHLKFKLYQENGVKYYLLADPDKTFWKFFI